MAVLAALVLATCSSSQRRDQNYGTDAGAGYQPEAAAFSNPDTSAGDDGGNESETGSGEAEPDGQDADVEVGS